MRQQLSKIWILVLLVLLLGQFVTISAYSVNPEDLRLVVVWNDGVSNAEAPYGWQVGLSSNGDGSDAPEVGKAVLHHLIASLDTLEVLGHWNTLDTAGVPDQLTSNTGIQIGGVTRFSNMRIYTSSSAPSYATVKASFAGQDPNAIIYLNSGVTSSNAALYTLLQEANAANVGIVTIGDNSAVEAKNIDPTKNIFPVMGNQKTFRVRQAPNDILKEFNFIAANDTLMIGSVSWTVPDTVILRDAGGVGEVWLQNESQNTRILTIAAGGVAVIDPASGYGADPVLLQVAADLLYQYGTFSIRAQVVEVIDRDDYSPDMNAGLAYNFDVWYGAANGKVHVANVAWTRTVKANDSLIAGRGDTLPIPSSLLNAEGANLRLTGDFIVAVPSWKPGVTDSIVVLKSGTLIRPIVNDGTDNADDGTWLGSTEISATGGHANLRIELDKTGNNAVIFGAIFPSLSGVSSLTFKPWSTNGRIQADADMWEIYNNVDTAHFGSIPGTGFDSTKYYYCYLGDQVAGGWGYNQFVKAPKTYAEYDQAIALHEFDNLPGGEYADKLYHAISAIRHSKRRIVMLGFQPNYLDDIARSLGVVYDAVIWAAYDNYTFPTPTFDPLDTTRVHTDFSSVDIVVDFPDAAIEISAEPFDLYYSATYGGTTISGSALNHTGDYTYTWDISALNIDSSNQANNQVAITAWVTPAVFAGYSPSDTGSANYTIREIVGGAFDTSGFEYGNGPTDTLVFVGSREIDLIAKFDNVEVGGAEVTYTFTGGTSTSGTVPTGTRIQVTGPGVSVLTVYATKGSPGGYITSDTITYVFKRGAEQLTDVVVNPNTVAAGSSSGYLFAEDSALGLSLTSTTSPGGVPITTSDYDVRYVFGVMGDTTNPAVIGGTLDSCVPVAITTAMIDAVIAIGDTAITFSAFSFDQPGSSIEWGSSNVTTEQYNFRRADVQFTPLDSTGPGVNHIITVHDSINSDFHLSDASVIVTNAGVNNGTVSSGDTILIPHGVTYSFQGIRKAYIPSAVEDQSVAALPIDLKLYAVWMPTANVSDFADIASPLPVAGSDPFNGIEDVVLLMLNPTANYDASGGIPMGVEVVSVRILDPIGNVIVSSDGWDYTSEHIRIVPATTTIYDGVASTPNQFVVAVAWDGRNINNRPVGASAYNVIIETKWPDGTNNIEVTTALISVKHREGLKNLD